MVFILVTRQRTVCRLGWPLPALIFRQRRHSPGPVSKFISNS